MRYKNPNLARRPFVNQRPVVRVSILLWGLGIALFALNVFVYWSFTRGQDVKREQLRQIRSAIEREQKTIHELQNHISRIDLESENDQVAFLNQKIHERTFGWSLLFDTLAEILPDDVRLGRLTLSESSASDSRRRRRARAADEEAMDFAIQGEARSFEALLTFMKSLYTSVAFDDVNLSRDSRDGNLTRFQLGVTYYPSRAAAAQAVDPPAEGELPAPQSNGGALQTATAEVLELGEGSEGGDPDGAVAAGDEDSAAAVPVTSPMTNPLARPRNTSEQPLPANRSASSAAELAQPLGSQQREVQ